MLVIVPLFWYSILGVIFCSLRRSLSNKQLLLHQVSKNLLTICQPGLSPGVHLPANPWASPTLSIWSSWQESAQECRSLVCPPTRAPTLSTLDQLDKWKEEGETRTRWGTSLQFSSNLPTPILLEGTEKPSHKTKSPSYEPIHLTRTCGLLLRAFILKDIDLWIKLCLLWLEGPQHTFGDSWYLRREQRLGEVFRKTKWKFPWRGGVSSSIKVFFLHFF